MNYSTVTQNWRSGLTGHDPRTVLAFAAIYLLWGATFLAIRVAVVEIPPFFTAGVRFLIAGGLLYALVRLRGAPAPSVREWRGLALTALCLFVVTYAALFWAEQYVASGVTAIFEATLPLITLALEVFVFRHQPFRGRMLGVIAMGFGAVAWLLWQGDGQPLPLLPCLAILGSCVAWSLGAVLTRAMSLPRSPALAAGAQMMLGGAVLLALSAASGELEPFPHVSLRAGLALLYLIVAGSWVGFTAYVWLLTRMPATRVASHAYVNPVVALALGALLAGEQVTLGMLLAAAVVVGSVFLILKAPQRQVARPAALFSATRERQGGGEVVRELEPLAVRPDTHLREDRAWLLAQSRKDDSRAVPLTAREQCT
jgi:drug/metabolite transporter (DMT)-like permease